MPKSKPPRKKPVVNTVQTTMRFGVALRDRLDKVAHRSGISRSMLIQHILTLYLDKHSRSVVDLAVRPEAPGVEDVML